LNRPGCKVSPPALQFHERRVMPDEHNGSPYFIVSNFYGIDLHRST
jgi:hypothetical protein